VLEQRGEILSILELEINENPGYEMNRQKELV
jgi:hypothetical protein